MKASWVAQVLTLTWGLALAPAWAADAQAGREKARAGKCFDCHGENGVAAVSGYPNLAGQHPAYLRKQIADFRSGARKSPFMNIVASEVKEEDLDDIVAWFAALPRERPAPVALPAAHKLYQEGDAARALASCASCHGATGLGLADGNVPAVAGQQMFYLREQLLNWHLGLRNNSAGRSMNRAADPLTEAEIEALARYMAGM
jgi:cytochrome c553